MRKIVVSEYLTLDGVMDEPGRWSFPFWSEEAAQFKSDELFASDALLLGRITYQGFAAAWPAMQAETGAFGERMNNLPKYVVSTTLATADWNNSRLIRANVADEIARLKQEPGQDILVNGSGVLLDTLLEHALVDELRLMVHPIVVGAGKRLFREGSPRQTWLLTGTRPFASGIVVLTYAPAAEG